MIYPSLRNLLFIRVIERRASSKIVCTIWISPVLQESSFVAYCLKVVLFLFNIIFLAITYNNAVQHSNSLITFPFFFLSYLVWQKTALFADNSNPFGGKSLEYTGGDDPNNKNYGRLSEKLDEADIERKKASEAARAFERQAEIKREERRRKIKFMNDMPDDTPAGKGK